MNSLQQRDRYSSLYPCRSGGIGRRAWFRSTYSQGCGGSSPFFGTNLISSSYVRGRRPLAMTGPSHFLRYIHHKGDSAAR